MNIAVADNRINSVSHPKWPKWFNIDKYECLQDLTVQDFLSELEVRLRLITMPTLAGRRLSDDELWQFVEKGYVELRNH